MKPIRLSRALTAAALLLGAVLPSAACAQSATDVIAFENVTVIPMTNDRALPGHTVLVQGDRIVAADLALRAEGSAAERLDEMSLEDVELLLIKKALARHDGNVSKVAESLGLSRSAMYRRLQRFGL